LAVRDFRAVGPKGLRNTRPPIISRWQFASIWRRFKIPSRVPTHEKSTWRSDLPKVPGVPHLPAVRALEKAGFRIVREGKHIVMSSGARFVTIPRNNPVHAVTMGGIVRDAGLTVEEFKNLF
jgi:predicted RNA binding protein YcfA (HicA-like mRNA interferase family)